ncbi:MAG: Na/Pi cotransporter family protein [Deferrisomatales bacterium]
MRKALLPLTLAVLAYGLWASSHFTEIAAGVAVFILGMLSLEQGFRALAGGVLEGILRRTTDRPWKSLAFGVVTTTILQSSSLVSVLTISFLSAGLLGLAEGVGIVFGANLGTTTGAWLVAGFGLKVDIAAYAMPMLVLGVVLVLQRPKALKAAGYVLTGLGFLFLGIHHMKEGFEAFRQGLDLTRFAVAGVKGVLLFALLGGAATVVVQSSHATLVLTITALAAHQITYENALALAIGANVGTTVTAVLGALGANEQGKRLAAAHVLFNVATGAVAVVFLGPLMGVVDAATRAVGIAADEHLLKLAAFHTAFNLLGLGLFVPFTKPLVGLLGRWFPVRAASAAEPRYLNRAAVDFPDTAVEAVRNEVLRMFDDALALVARVLGLEPREVFSEDDLGRALGHRVEVPPFDVDEEYEHGIKALYGAVVAFISRAAFTWQAEQSGRLHWLRNAAGHLVEAVKAAKHLQKNLVRHAASPNPYQRAEYQGLRLQVAGLLRRLEGLGRVAEGADVVVALDAVRLAADELEQGLPPRLYRLLHEGRVSPAAATSLLNDYGYARELARDLAAAAGTLFLDTRAPAQAAQRAVTLDAAERQQVLAEARETTGQKGATPP